MRFSSAFLKTSQEDSKKKQYFDLLVRLWDSFDENISARRLDDIDIDYDSIDWDYEYEAYIDMYMESFEIEQYLEYQNNDDVEELWIKYIEGLAEEGELGSKHIVELERLIFNRATNTNLDSASDYRNTFYGLTAALMTEETEQKLIDIGVRPVVNEDGSKHFYPKNLNSPSLEGFQKTIISIMLEDPEITKFLQTDEDTQFEQETVEGGNVPYFSNDRSFYERKDPLIKGFLEWADQVEVSDEDKANYIKNSYRSSMEESIIDSHYEMAKEDIREHKVHDELEALSREERISIDGVLKVDKFFQDSGYFIKERDDWLQHISPFCAQIKSLVANMSPEEKSATKADLERFDEVWDKFLDLNLPFDYSRFEAVQANPEILNEYIKKRDSDRQVQEEIKKLYRNTGIMVTTEQYQKLLQDPSYMEEIKKNYDHDLALKLDQEHKRIQEQDRYKKKVETPHEPLVDNNQQTMLNLVNKVKQKGNISKQELAGFFQKYKV